METKYNIRNINETCWNTVDGTTDSRKWGGNFSLTCDSMEQLPYAEKCLSYLDNLPDETEKKLRRYLLRYFRDYEQYYDTKKLEEWGVMDENTIFSHIHINLLIVDKKCRQDRIEFHVSGSCCWEPEHGLEITFSDNRILYVGSFNDHGPNSSRLRYALEHYGYYDPASGKSMNYADKE